MRDAVRGVGVHLIVKKTSEWCGSISMFGTAHCLLLVELEHDELGDDDEGKYKLLMLEQEAVRSEAGLYGVFTAKYVFQTIPSVARLAHLGNRGVWNGMGALLMDYTSMAQKIIEDGVADSKGRHRMFLHRAREAPAPGSMRTHATGNAYSGAAKLEFCKQDATAPIDLVSLRKFTVDFANAHPKYYLTGSNCQMYATTLNNVLRDKDDGMYNGKLMAMGGGWFERRQKRSTSSAPQRTRPRRRRTRRLSQRLHALAALEA